MVRTSRPENCVYPGSGIRDPGSGESVVRSDPAFCTPACGRNQLLEGNGRGATPPIARATALIWSGVVPQQPPRMFTKPLVAKSRSSTDVSCGCSSYSPKALG